MNNILCRVIVFVFFASSPVPLHTQSAFCVEPIRESSVQKELGKTDCIDLVRALARNNKDSYHLLLWRSLHLFRVAGLQDEFHKKQGVLWTHVRDLLEKAGVKRASVLQGDGFAYAFPTKFRKDQSHFPIEFYLTFIVDETTGTVVRVEPHVVVKPDTTFVDFQKASAKSNDAILKSIAKIDHVISYAKTHPIVKRVDIRYGSLGTLTMNDVPMGFIIEIEMAEPKQRKDLYLSSSQYSVGSNLDPPSDSDGQPAPGESGRAEDTLYSQEMPDDLRATSDGKPTLFLERALPTDFR